MTRTRVLRWILVLKRRVEDGAMYAIEAVQTPIIFLMGFFALLAIAIHVAYLYVGALLIIAIILVRRVKRAIAKRRPR